MNETATPDALGFVSTGGRESRDEEREREREREREQMPSWLILKSDIVNSSMVTAIVTPTELA